MDGAPSHFNFQWQRNGADVPGATGPEYVLPSVDDTAVGAYVCVVSNAGGQVVSSPAQVTLLPSPPVVVKDAEDTVVPYGAPTTLHVKGTNARHGWGWGGRRRAGVRVRTHVGHSVSPSQ